MTTVKLTRAAMVALMVTASFKQEKVEKWEDAALMDRVIDLPNKVTAEEAAKWPALQKAQYVELVGDDVELEMVGDGLPKSGGKGTPTPPAKENAPQGKVEGKKGASKAAVPAAKPVKTKPAKDAGERSLGALGGYKGHSIASVIRAFGKAGWSKAEATTFFASQKIAASPASIIGGLVKGAKGLKSIAPLTQNELKAIRPQLAEKPAKKAAK